MTDRRLISLLRTAAVVGGIGALIGSAVIIGVADFETWWSIDGGFLAFVSISTAVLMWWVLPQQPKNAFAWVMTVVAFSPGVHLLGMAGAALVVRESSEMVALAVSSDLVPAQLPTSAALIKAVTFPIGVVTPLGLFAFLVFPDGRLPSPRWRWVVVLALVGIAALVTGAAWGMRPGNTSMNQDQFLFRAGQMIVAAGAVLSLAALVVRFRHSSGEVREQFKWVVWGASIFVPMAVMSLVIDAPRFQGLESVLLMIGGVVLIAALGIAVGRHRLFDINVVISRTVVVAGLAGFITVVYAVIVGAIGFAVGSREEATLPLSIAATVVVAIAFQPLRVRMRTWADRLVYGERATPYEVLSRFSAHMRDAVDVEEVIPQLAQLLVAGTGASRAVVWTNSDGQLTPLAIWPGDEINEVSAVLVDGTPSITGVDHLATVEHEGELLGAMTVTMPANEELTKSQEQLVDDVASQAGLVLRNARLVRELRASRQRLVSAQDEERRRLERDLHDGAQQQLIAIKMKLSVARQLVARGDGNRAEAMLGEVLTDMDEGVESLRELAHGIFPPLLESEGLPTALRARAAKAPVRVAVSATEEVRRYPPEVEAAVYFCVLEALQNAAKYANANGVEVSLTQDDGHLVFRVTDDGDGFEMGADAKGRGLTNMTDRIEALGGTLEIRSIVGTGTTVSGSIPVTVTS
ncbi:MAG: sensor histidine kinase [Acidimicrobiia bacterium]|nr:sensor histidine kinase [Acidimicrobiia bacterium]